MPAGVTPPGRCSTERRLPRLPCQFRRGSHAVIRKVGQQRGLHSSREDLGTNLISIQELVTAKLDPSAGLVLIGLATRYSWNHA